MRFSAAVFASLLLLLFSNLTFSQNSATSNPPEKITESLLIKRTERIKADILQEIKSLPGKEQAEFYATFGRIFLNTNKKETTFWITNALKIALSPSTQFKNQKEKINVLRNILIFDEVLENEEELLKKPLAKITGILYEEIKAKGPDEYNEILISLANQLVLKDEKSAFDLAILSLNGSKPAINGQSFSFFKDLKQKNENLSDQYFAKLLKTIKSSGNSNFIMELGRISFVYISDVIVPQNISESQERDFFEVLALFIQKESEELSQKNRSDCALTKSFGKIFLEDYRRLWPQRADIIEQAINICQAAEIDFWKKPDLNRTLKTSQDLLDFAREINDRKIQANYLKSAASFARNERNFQLSNSILDSIDLEFHDTFWNWLKIELASNLIAELFRNDDFAEITKIVESSLPEHRPFIILKGLNSIWRLKPNQKEFVVDLMKKARADFINLDKYLINPIDFSTNPTQFGALTQLYVKFGLFDEAIETHEESIKSLNRIIRVLPPEYKDKKVFPRLSSYSRFSYQYPPNDTDFINRYFDRIYENIGKIEDYRIRIAERIDFLRQNLEKAKGNNLISRISESVK